MNDAIIPSIMAGRFQINNTQLKSDWKMEAAADFILPFLYHKVVITEK